MSSGLRAAGAPATPHLHLIFSIWMAVVVFSFTRLYVYQNLPAVVEETPRRWPAAAGIERSPTGPTLVMFLHPRCPCSRASVGELSRVLAKVGAPVVPRFVMYHPPGESADWSRGDLEDSAELLPGSRFFPDAGGERARAFGVNTSGHVLVYDAAGALAYSGGVTVARGHHGDNPGAGAVLAALRGEVPATRQGPTFGCGIRTAGDPGCPTTAHCPAPSVKQATRSKDVLP